MTDEPEDTGVDDSDWEDERADIDDLRTDLYDRKWPYALLMCLVLGVSVVWLALRFQPVQSWVTAVKPHAHEWIAAPNGTCVLRPEPDVSLKVSGGWRTVTVEMCKTCRVLRLP